MLESSRIWPALLTIAALAAAGCAETPTQPAAPAATAAQAVPAAPPAAPAPDPKARLEEARALLAQAETDVQRARAKRALWQKAWEELVAARNAVAAGDAPKAIDHAHRASELAQLGLEQLAYPAVQ